MALETPDPYFDEKRLGESSASAGGLLGALNGGALRGSSSSACSASSMFDLFGHRNPFPSMSSASTALGSDSPLAPSTPTSLQQSDGGNLRYPFPSPSLSPTGSRRTSPNPMGKPTLENLAALREAEFSSRTHELKPFFVDAIQELYEELEMVEESVAGQAVEHVHSRCACGH